ncbi:hypothetical protein PK35_09035 [Tamlana nanhaiensis]|uniref:Secretion system C-terminal sorting domain-containing protein n=1 Tax=Neotamlana nanhaiensis TaxID=1382798 RepID=A0A0D7W1T4_9FLAO|nr:leucine-rich repeat domain-containing protein [Tamlana nanhaiensis]KJD33095.1 hypothetical protein PK35_09035 [Tamlana nanhaiensis]
MKKSLLFLVAILYAFLGQSQTFTDNFITYEVTSSNTVRTTTYNTAGGADVIIPESVTYLGAVYVVTNIGPSCFSSKQLNSVEIPSTVTEIRSSAFQHNNLTSVVIPEHVSNVQSWSFMNNPLTSVTCLNTTPPFIPNAGTGDAFDNRSTINLTIPFGTSGVYVTDANAKWTGFNSVSDTPTFVIDFITYEVTSVSTVRTIGYNTAGGANVVIPSSVTYGGVTYSVTNIGPSSFSAKQLNSVEIPSTVTEIRSSAFQHNNLTSVVIPEHVSNVQSWSFMNNPLTSVTSLNTTPPFIPNAGTGDVFDDRSTINLIIPFGTSGVYVTDANAKWTGFNSVSDAAIFELDYISYEVTSASTVRTIGYNTAGGADVVIPSNVAYGGVTYSVTNIGPSSFSAKQLNSVEIPNTVTEIRSSAFQHNNLTSVSIPASVSNVQSWSFMNNPLTSVTSLNTTPPNIPNAGTGDAFDDRSVIDLVIPNGTTGVYVTDTNAKWTGFNSVSESLLLNETFISNDATFMVISTTTNSIELIDYDIAGGTNLNIPTTVEENGVTYRVKSIGNSAFENKGITSVTIPEGVTSIGIKAFNTNNLTNLTIPESVVTISSQAFANNNLSSLTLGENINTIALAAFAGNNLTQITLPKNVANIEALAFAANPLVSVKSLATTPPTVVTGNNDSFDVNGDRSGIDLMVPKHTKNSYLANSWTGFNTITEINTLSKVNFEIANYVKVISTYNGLTVVTSNNVTLQNYTIYNLSGVKVKSGQENKINTNYLASGVYILRLKFNKGQMVKKFAK